MQRTLLQFGLCLLLAGGLAAPAVAQGADSSASVGQAEEIFQRMLKAMGGEAYLGATEVEGRGRIYSFNRGDLSSPGERFLYYAKFPGKERIEFGKKGNIVYVNADEQGWELDRQGIREQTPEQIADFRQSNQRELHNVLRSAAQAENRKLYLVGRQFLDNRRVHILELVDDRGESVQVYVDSNTYLPLQLRYRERDALTREWMDVVEYYGKYITVQGVKTAMHLSRARGKLRVLEVYFSEVRYNSGIPDSLFTRESLEERWARVKK